MIDSHCHLTDSRYDNLNEIIDSFKADGLESVITIGYDSASSMQAMKLSEINERVYFSAGIHPSEIDHEESLDVIKELLKHKKNVALGEVGLEYHYEDSPDHNKQKEWFVNQLDLAIEAHKPVVIHSRDCDGDILPILKSYAKKLMWGCEIHCFSSSEEIAKEYVKLGFFIAFGGAITFKNARKDNVIRAVPDELLLAETDAPYLTPVPHRGELNYPKYVRHVIEKLALVRGSTFEEIERLTSLNAKKFFGI
ncbi:MAG: TatD family hydrolase [Clostridia bacterium]|nr:TatD family hydrolase [Clostridia bacterium]